MATKKRGRPAKQWPKYTEAEIRHMIKKVNDSLYRLEKAGLQSASAEYRKIEMYAVSNPNGTGKMYNVNMEKGTIRVSKDLSKYKTKKEREKFIKVLEGILNSQTRTVSGTRKAMIKGFQKVKKLYGFKGTQLEWTRIWVAYRTLISPNKKSKIGSDKVVEMIEKTNLYQLSNRELTQTMNILNRSRSADSGVRSALKYVKGLKVVKRARKKKKL